MLAIHNDGKTRDSLKAQCLPFIIRTLEFCTFSKPRSDPNSCKMRLNASLSNEKALILTLLINFKPVNKKILDLQSYPNSTPERILNPIHQVDRYLYKAKQH